MATLAMTPAFASAQPVDDLPSAREHMAAGVEHLQHPEGADYAAAYPEFMRAYDLSGSTNALRNAALCAMRTDRYRIALAMLEEVVKQEGPKLTPSDREQIDRDVQYMRSKGARAGGWSPRKKPTDRRPSLGEDYAHAPEEGGVEVVAPPSVHRNRGCGC